MYCKTCGAEIHNGADFCPVCGSSERHRARRRVRRPPLGSSPVLTLRPTFVPWLSVLSALPVQLLMTLWGALFFGGFATFIIQAAHIHVPKFVPFLITGIALFFAIPIFVYFAKQRTYAQMEYRFFAHKLDYFDGFLTTEEKSIDYRNITGVNLRRGLLQKIYGLGTIVLSTPATGIMAGHGRRGIRIVDIPNAESVYAQIEDLLKRL